VFGAVVNGTLKEERRDVMKLDYFWDKNYAIDQIGIRLNPQNRKLTVELNSLLKGDKKLNVINPLNKRKLKINYDEIYLIEAMDSLSKVYTTGGKVFYARGRLKDFENKEISGIVRINNSTMLNLTEIINFRQGTYARLEVETKDGQVHIVSRHYAQKIKEALECSRN
jgi:DNA-binding LytR/AlgR family response regulator